jgi:rubrerythrin
MISIARGPIDKLLGYAMRAEIDSGGAYTEMSTRVKNPLLIEKFRMLAFEEKKHKTALDSLFQSMYPGDAPEIPERVDAKLLPAVVIGPSTDLIEVLRQAMGAETASQQFYAGLAKRVDVAKKKILLYLSKVERGHYMMLRGEYAMAQQFADYGEKDIDKVVT